MEKCITLQRKSVYGTELAYCVSDHKEFIHSLTGRKTVSQDDITALEGLGFTVLTY